MIRDGARNEPGDPRQVSGSGLMFIDGAERDGTPIWQYRIVDSEQRVLLLDARDHARVRLLEDLPSPASLVDGAGALDG